MNAAVQLFFIQPERDPITGHDATSIQLVSFLRPFWKHLHRYIHSCVSASESKFSLIHHKKTNKKSKREIFKKIDKYRCNWVYSYDRNTCPSMGKSCLGSFPRTAKGAWWSSRIPALGGVETGRQDFKIILYDSMTMAIQRGSSGFHEILSENPERKNINKPCSINAAIQ